MSTTPQPSKSDGPARSPLALLHAIRKAWYVALPVAVTVALAVTFYTLTDTKIYESSASILFDPQPPRPLGTEVQTAIDLSSGSYLSNREYYRTQQEVLKSRNVSLATVKRLRLNYDAGFINLKSGVSKSAKPIVAEDVAARILSDRINVQTVKDSRLVTVSLADADAQRAQRVLSTLLDIYTQQNLDTAVESSNTSAEWLDDQLAKLKTELQSSEMSLHDYKFKNNILSVSLDDQSNMLREEMSRLNTLLTDAKARREEISARRKELQKLDDQNPLEVPAAELLNNMVLSSQRQNYATALADREALIGGGKGENHPDVRAASARVGTAREALMAEVRNIKQSVDRDYSAINSQVEGLAGLFETAKKHALDLNLLEIEYNRLNRGKQNTEKLYTLVLERTKELDLTRMMRFNNIRVLDAASLPKAPIKPRVPLNIALGILAGLGLGIAAAIGRELMDRTIKTPEHAEQTLGLSPLGLLPAIGELSSGSPYHQKQSKRRAAQVAANEVRELYVHNHPASGLAEAAKSIRTNILFISPDRPFQILLITSAGPLEGKTTTACCIATAMAQAGQRVLLLDCDMRRPRLHRVFDRANDTGVTTALLDVGKLDECIGRTPVPNLDILPCGPLPPNPAELLHSAAFERVLSALRERYDRIIVDSPPVAPVTDAAVLSTRVDGTIFVVRAFRTSRDMAERAVRSLRAVGGSLVGVVLNDVDFSRADYGYQQYYYYRKEGYGRQPEGGKADAA